MLRRDAQLNGPRDDHMARIDLGGQAGQNAVNAAKAAKAKQAAANKAQQPDKPIANHRQMETAAGAVRGAHTATKPKSKILQPADGVAQLHYTLPAPTSPATDYVDANTFRQDVLRAKGADLTERRARLDQRLASMDTDDPRAMEAFRSETALVAKAEAAHQKQVDQHLARVERDFLMLATKVSAPRNTVPTAAIGEMFKHLAPESKPAALKMYKTHLEAKVLQLREDTDKHAAAELAVKSSIESYTAELAKANEILATLTDPAQVRSMTQYRDRTQSVLTKATSELLEIGADGARIAREQARTVSHSEEYARLNPSA